MLAATAMDPVRGFAASLRRAAGSGELAVISEIKRRSPSKGALNIELDPATMASRYADGGAAAMSVLTDEEFMGAHRLELPWGFDPRRIDSLPG